MLLLLDQSIQLNRRLLNVSSYENRIFDIVILSRLETNWLRSVEDVERSVTNDVAGIGSQFLAKLAGDWINFEVADGNPDRVNIRPSRHKIRQTEAAMLAEIGITIRVAEIDVVVVRQQRANRKAIELRYRVSLRRIRGR